MSQEARMQRAKEQGFVYDIDLLVLEKAREQGRLSVLPEIVGSSESVEVQT